MIHFDARYPAQQLLESPRSSADGAFEVFDQLGWYCRWASESAAAAYALVPHSLKSRASIIAARLGLPVIWYTDELDFKLPDTLRGISQIWLMNANELPLVDWQAAREEVRRSPADVVVFGWRGFSAEGPYPETVLVDDADRVIRFRRHYFDSPAFADRWGGSASFLAVPPRLGHSVTNHVLVRGWGLESIGAMTRRFQVRWAGASCLQAAFSDERQDVEYLDEVVERGEPSSRRRGELMAEDSVVAGVPARLLKSRWVKAHPGGGALRESEDVFGGLGGPASWRPLLMEDLTEAQIAGDAIYLFGKRAMDLALASIGLVILSPLLLAVAVLIKLTSRGPILFGHKRQGLGGKEFRCWKFRSMKVGADKLQDTLRELNEVDGPQFKIANDPRITSIGRWLRRTNIDELPQLLNVLAGSMSLVGPRPSPDNENQICPAWRRARLSVKPGITGLWQVLRLRDDPAADFQEWIYYDVEYAKHRSLWLDLQILLHTPIAIAAPKRVSRLARRLQRFGICPHSRQQPELEEPSPAVAAR